jgi:urease accessory protein
MNEFDASLGELRLLHLADSALPIGGLAHSFGLESLVAQGLLGAKELPEFFLGFLEEAGMAEAVFCREGFRLAAEQGRWSGQVDGATDKSVSNGPRRLQKLWVELNDRVSAMKPARESRMGSAALGRNFLAAVVGLGDFAIVREALAASQQARSLIHHGPAFGLAGGALGFEEGRTVLAYLHQSIASLVSACQRLMPLGQSAATKILWDLKPVMLQMAKHSAECALDDAHCFLPLLDWGAMEHPGLTTRLFIS